MAGCGGGEGGALRGLGHDQREMAGGDPSRRGDDALRVVEVGTVDADHRVDMHHPAPLELGAA